LSKVSTEIRYYFSGPRGKSAGSALWWFTTRLSQV